MVTQCLRPAAVPGAGVGVAVVAGAAAVVAGGAAVVAGGGAVVAGAADLTNVTTFLCSFVFKHEVLAWLHHLLT